MDIMKIKHLFVGLLGLVITLSAGFFYQQSTFNVGGDGTIYQLQQWKNDGTYITQTVANTLLKLTGYESSGDCLVTNASGVVSTAACGTGSGGGSNWTIVSGGLRTSTTTDFAQAAYVVASSSSATSTFAGGVTARNIGINGTAGAGYLTLLGQSVTPSAPVAGSLLIHSLTTNGYTRLVTRNEALNDIVLGQDNVFLAKNTSGGVVTKGQVVYVTGSVGKVPTISLAKSDSPTTTRATIGVAIETSVADNSFGQFMVSGILDSIDTSAFTTGNTVYISSTVAGGLTATRPVYPNFPKAIGVILNSGVGNGSILVNVAPFTGGQESGTNATSFTAPAFIAISTTTPSTFAGSVGVGTTSPISKFTVAGATATSTFEGIVNIGTVTNRFFEFGLFPILDIVSNSTSSNQPVVLITSTSTEGGNADIRFNSPNIDIEFVETDQIAPAGKFEWGIQNDKMNFNLRNGADNSFVPGMSFSPLTGRMGFAVGIGTEYNNPGSMLSVVATSSKEAFNITSAASHAAGTEVGDLFSVGNSGITAIGSSSPSTGKLTVVQTGNATMVNLSQSNSATTDYLRLESSAASAGNNPCIGWYNLPGAVNNAKLCSTNGASYTASNMTFSVANSSKALTERMRIDVDGDVGIGTTTPGAKLAVTGTSGASILQFVSDTGTKFLELLNTGVATLLGAWDFGGATSIEIVNGSAPAVDAIGEIAFDTTDNQLLIASSTDANAPIVIPGTVRMGAFTISSTSQPFASGFVTGKTISLPTIRDGYKVTELYCTVIGGTSIVMNFDNGSGNTSTITCTTAGASLIGVGANAVVTAGATTTAMESGTVTGAPDYLKMSIYGTYIRE
jgi:hypothetical protein